MASLILISAALGLSNFAAAIGIGLSGSALRARIRVALVFGLFEGAMPLLGLVIGHNLAGRFGSSAALVGGGLLVITGGYTLVRARCNRPDRAAGDVRLSRLVVTAGALSIDNLVVGFTLGTHRVSVALAAAVVAAVSVGMSLIGLEFGQRLGELVETWSEEIGGAVLVFVGVAIAANLF